VLQQNRVAMSIPLHRPTRLSLTGLEQMNARVAKEEIALLMPSSLASYADDAFAAPEEEAAANMLIRAARWIMELPRRRAVLSQLNALSDHELADIGINRGDLARVFDAEFAARCSAVRYNLGRSAMA
jgi:uncharacterized protein YjiS (DUF1127 family)